MPSRSLDVYALSPTLMKPLSIRLRPQAGKSLVIPNPSPQAGEGTNAMPKPINELDFAEVRRLGVEKLALTRALSDLTARFDTHR